MSLFWKPIHTNSVIGTQLEDLSMQRCRLRHCCHINHRMGTTFTNNGASTYQCMQNFQLTQWLAGASACVFPGAYPNIEAAQGSIKGFIKNLYSSVWGQIAIGLLQVAMPTIQTLIRDIDNIDLPSFYQSLSDKGMLTANVSTGNEIALIQAL